MASQNQWVYDLENLTYAIVKTRCEKKLKTKYPKLKFTQEEQSDSATASFPTVLVQALEPIEQNEDLSLLSWERGLKSDGSFGKHVRFARRSSRGSVD